MARPLLTEWSRKHASIHDSVIYLLGFGAVECHLKFGRAFKKQRSSRLFPSPTPTNWLRASQVYGWTKLNRPIARAKRIAARFPAGASRKNSSLQPSNRPKRETFPSSASIFSGRTSAAFRQPTRKAISKWQTSFYLRH